MGSLWNKILLVVGILLIGISIACFAASSELQGMLSNPNARLQSMFSQQAAYQMQTVTSQAKLFQYGGILTVAVGGVLIAVGLIGLIRK
jgi:hypothetical protein